MVTDKEGAPAEGSHFKLIVRDSTVYAVGRIALSALDLLLLPLYTRVLTPDEFGLVALAASVMAVVTLVFPFGFTAALGRFYFDHEEGGRDQRSVVGTLVSAIAIMGFLVAVVLSLIGPGIGAGFLDDFSQRFFLIIVWTAFLGIFPALWLQLLQLQRRPRSYVAFALAHAVVRGGLTLLFVWSLARGPVGWGEAYFITSAAACLVSIALGRRQILLVIRPDVLSDAARYALPVLLHQIAGWITTNANRFILNQLVTLRAVGVFQVAFGLGQVMSLIVTSFNFAYAPRFMAMATLDEEKASIEFGAMATSYLAGIVGIALVVSLFSEEVVAIVAGVSYGEAASLVPIVLAMFVLQGVYYLLANPVYYSKVLTRALPAITVAGALVNVFANYALIPQLGILGAAWAGLATNVFVVVGTYILARRALNIRYEFWKIGCFSITAIALVSMTVWLTGLSLDGFQRLSVQIVCVVAYLIVLWSLGIARPAALCRAGSLQRRPPKTAD